MMIYVKRMIERKMALSLAQLLKEKQGFFSLVGDKTLSLGELNECNSYRFKSIFACIFEALMLNLVKNYGIFTKLLFCKNYCQNRQKNSNKRC